MISYVKELKTAINTFKIQYGHLPGDLPNAFSYWGADNGCTNDVGLDTSCNGDGSGTIDSVEHFHSWQHLRLAEIIQESYNGIHVKNDVLDDNLSSLPHVKGLNNTIFFAFFSSPTRFKNSTSTTDNAYSYSNIFVIGASTTSNTQNHAIASAFSPEEALSLDKKMDDGTPCIWFITCNSRNGKRCWYYSISRELY